MLVCFSFSDTFVFILSFFTEFFNISIPHFVAQIFIFLLKIYLKSTKILFFNPLFFFQFF
ncbi:unnamed protein product [Meloidogyne enterolobii]|uniref:Uncharacterized protein n=1 Tax=Meloidogyne enterolobii TaxID=390850 RepID=A0ACB1AUB8_MELEN